MANDSYILQNYDYKPTFSGFLPGIAGACGIPAWCYYNNRGQAVCSFGVRDKDHSIMEFSPAHIAYQNVSRTGFRTFFRRNGGDVQEAFCGGSSEMQIDPNGLTLRWTGGQESVQVQYFTLPECPVGALCRIVTLTNCGDAAEYDLLDGMPALVPYGVNQDMLKNMTQLSKAWMQVEDAAEGRAFFRVRASMADTAVVTAVEGGNFALAFTADGQTLPAVVDPRVVFGYDTSLAQAVGFAAPDFADRAAAQACQNQFPCAFFRRTAVLKQGESLYLYELYGQAENKAAFHAFTAEPLNESWFDAKQARARVLADDLCAAADVRTADPVFDAYTRYTYLDNLLRGGEPVRFADGDAENIFYLYSRKHGDPEREYNYFTMLPEYYSQGNGNYRDVNQNRRCDVRFQPWVKDTDIRQFFSLVQTDGYNPLVVEEMTFTTRNPAPLLAMLAPADADKASELLAAPYTPGKLAMAAEHWQYAPGYNAQTLVRTALAHADCEPNADFKEGYWTDHWTYDLDLIESYLAVWPEQEKELLFGDASYPWFESRTAVLPRAQRYEKTSAGWRQTKFLRPRQTDRKWVQTTDGAIARSPLIEKLILLCAVKTAALDPAGIGIEMEGGKPGWYDALNGLPALFGSSVAESCELARLLAFTTEKLRTVQAPLALYTEIADLAEALASLPACPDPAARWDYANRIKEQYRVTVENGLAGARKSVAPAELAAVLDSWLALVQDGLTRAAAMQGGICPTHLLFSTEDGEHFTPHTVPLFLEGPTRWMKTAAPADCRRMAEAVRSSDLYDKKLEMYKVNASLAPLTFEAGRAKAFTPGWLENESVWLHMEYKYLLELLKAGLYAEFSAAFRTAAVPFLNPNVYGRSPLENVSFIVSSANPDPALHGRGFVARLSGSTAEFLQMRELMFFGKTPFILQNGSLALRLAPFLPEYLIPASREVSARFAEQCEVTYRIAPGIQVVPGQYRIAGMALDGHIYAGDTLPTPAAEAVRSGSARRLIVQIQEA